MARTIPMTHPKPHNRKHKCVRLHDEVVTPPEPGPCDPAPEIPMYCGDILDTGDVIAINEGDECDPCKLRLMLNPEMVATCWPEAGHASGCC